MQRGAALSAKRASAPAVLRLPEFTADIRTLQVPTVIGDATVTVYRPEGVGDLAPVHLNLHGGGYVLDLAVIDDAACRALAAQSGSVVLNVDYAVAPQHPFPEPPHQVYEVLRWVAENGQQHGWDGSRLTIGGQSAGGGLAAAAARLALEQGGPPILLQVLHYPPLDLALPASAKHSPLEKPLLRPWMGEVFDTAYVPDVSQRGDRLASPAGVADTADLTGIAPAVVIAADQDILRDEARRYAKRLEGVGALVEYREVAHADHGYDMRDDDAARATYGIIAEHMRRATALGLAPKD